MLLGPYYVSVPSFRPTAAASQNPQPDKQTNKQTDKFTEFIAPPIFFRPENLELPIGSEVQKSFRIFTRIPTANTLKFVAQPDHIGKKGFRPAY